MAIRKRGTGFQVRVRPFPEQTLPTKASAQRVERHLKERKALGELFLEEPTTFGEELDGRLERKKTMGGRRGALRPKTVEYYEQCVKPWEPLRWIPIPQLRRSIVEQHIMQRARVAPVAASNELEFAKATLRDAESRGQRVDRAIYSIEPIHHEPAEGRALEVDELDAIAAWMPERVQRLVPLCGLVGLRFSEATQLTDGMLDLENATLTIPRWLNKSRTEKPIPLATCEVQLLREQLMVRPPGTAVVFATQTGGTYTKSGFRSVWLPALLQAGLAHRTVNAKGQKVIVADFAFHWLRHTAISLMARAGMRAELIALRVGHNDGGALIHKRYRHLFPSELRAAVGLVDELVNAAKAAAGGQEVVNAD